MKTKIKTPHKFLMYKQPHLQRQSALNLLADAEKKHTHKVCICLISDIVPGTLAVKIEVAIVTS